MEKRRVPDRTASDCRRTAGSAIIRLHLGNRQPEIIVGKKKKQPEKHPPVFRLPQPFFRPQAA
jgi:hypothetical protein